MLYDNIVDHFNILYGEDNSSCSKAIIALKEFITDEFNMSLNYDEFYSDIAERNSY